MVASRRAYEVVVERSSDGILPRASAIERREAISLLSLVLRRDNMSDMVHGGVGMGTCGAAVEPRLESDALFFISLFFSKASSLSADAFSMRIALRQPSDCRAPERSGAPLNARSRSCGGRG